jgi:NAD(P)H-dependent FMN reductase
VEYETSFVFLRRRQPNLNSLGKALYSNSRIGQSEWVCLKPLTRNRLPVFNGDLESNVPEVCVEFKKQIVGADGMIIVTPEYNYSYVP